MAPDGSGLGTVSMAGDSANGDSTLDCDGDAGSSMGCVVSAGFGAGTVGVATTGAGAEVNTLATAAAAAAAYLMGGKATSLVGGAMGKGSVGFAGSLGTGGVSTVGLKSLSLSDLMDSSVPFRDGFRVTATGLGGSSALGVV